LDFKILILLIVICAIHNADSVKINRLIFQLRKSYGIQDKKVKIRIAGDYQPVQPPICGHRGNQFLLITLLAAYSRKPCTRVLTPLR